jgi:hypothetical protein
MTKKKTDLFHNRSSSKEFLLYKTDTKPKKDTAETLSSTASDRISKAFPDILAQKNFMDYAMAQPGSSKSTTSRTAPKQPVTLGSIYGSMWPMPSMQYAGVKMEFGAGSTRDGSDVFLTKKMRRPLWNLQTT